MHEKRKWKKKNVLCAQKSSVAHIAYNCILNTSVFMSSLFLFECRLQAPDNCFKIDFKNVKIKKRKENVCQLCTLQF